MNTRTRNLLTAALATVLAAPLAVATGLADADPGTPVQVETTQGELDAAEALPPQVNPVEHAEQEIDPRMPVEDAIEEPMDAVPPPVQSQDPAPAVDPAGDASDDAHRTRWAELDTDGDGRISAAEGAVDADFAANFEMIDGDSDGFVSEVEFQAHANAHPARDDDGMQHDGMQHDMDDGGNDAIDGVDTATDPIDG